MQQAPLAEPKRAAERQRPFPSRPSPAHVVDSSTGTRFEAVKVVDGKRYRCLGAGVRKVLFFKAYAVTFCLEDARMQEVVGAYLDRAYPDKEGAELAKALRGDRAFFDHLASAPGDKLVIMQLVRNISRDRIASAFRDSLGEVLSADRVERLIETIPGDGEDGQQILLHSHGSVLVIEIAGDAKRVDDRLIAENLWKVWLGKGAVAPSLEPSIAENVAKMR